MHSNYKATSMLKQHYHIQCINGELQGLVHRECRQTHQVALCRNWQLNTRKWTGMQRWRAQNSLIQPSEQIDPAGTCWSKVKASGHKSSSRGYRMCQPGRRESSPVRVGPNGTASKSLVSSGRATCAVATRSVHRSPPQASQSNRSWPSHWVCNHNEDRGAPPFNFHLAPPRHIKQAGVNHCRFWCFCQKWMSMSMSLHLHVALQVINKAGGGVSSSLCHLFPHINENLSHLPIGKAHSVGTMWTNSWCSVQIGKNK